MPLLLRNARSRCRDRDLAEDIVQDTLVKVFRAWDTIRDPNALDAFTMKTLHRSVIDTARRAAKQPHVVAHSIPDTAFATTPVEETSLLYELLLTVTPRQREILLLRYGHDVAVKDVAQVLGCSPSSVKSQASRTLASLRLAATRSGSVSPRSP